ncbi:MAG: MFS transporter [Chloroflexi bacterium]|nr:MFS transporter [Chloroflexota bacterium]
MSQQTALRRLKDAPHLAALKHRDYRMTWTANMFAGAAMWTFFVAFQWFTLDVSDSSGWVGIMTFASMIPFLVVSPFGGLMADLIDRRSLAQLMLLASFIVTAVLAALVISGAVKLWHVAALAFLGGAFRAVQEPTISALIPNQVPQNVLLNAITLNAATRHGARFFGLLIGAPLLAVPSIGVAGVLVLSALLAAVSTLLMSLVRTASRGDERAGQGVVSDMAKGIWAGLAYIYTNKPIALFIIMVALHCALVMSFDSILPVFTETSLGATDGSTLGWLVMGIGAGSLVGTLLLAGVRNEKTKGQLLVWTGLFSGITPMAMALSFNVPLGIAASVGMGISQATFMALTSTYVQTLAPDRLRGRISSLYILHAGGIMAFANLGYGFIADSFSAPPILLITGVAFVAVVLAVGFGQPILRRVYRTGQVAPA